MSEIISSIKNEFRKITARKKSVILCVITGIIAFSIAPAGAILGSSLHLASSIGQYYPIWLLSLMMKLLLPLFVLMTVIDSTTGEFQDDSIMNELQLPLDRYQLYLGKLSASLLFAGMLLAITYATSCLGAVIVSGFGIFSMLPQLLISYFSAWLALGLLTIIASLVGLFVRTTSLALVMCILLWAGFNVLGIFMSQLQAFLPTALVSAYAQIIEPSRLLCLISYYIIFTILGIFKFQAKEVI